MCPSGIEWLTAVSKNAICVVANILPALQSQVLKMHHMVSAADQFGRAVETTLPQVGKDGLVMPESACRRRAVPRLLAALTHH